jgi:hypothetical protein
MRRALLFVVIVPLLVGCTSPISASSPEGEFASDGTVKAVFNVGKAWLPDNAWVGMIELSGPPEHRCGPGDCGAAVGALRRGTVWPPGRWRAIPPRIRGMSVEAVVIVVEAGAETAFEFDYRPL